MIRGGHSTHFGTASFHGLNTLQVEVLHTVAYRHSSRLVFQNLFLHQIESGFVQRHCSKMVDLCCMRSIPILLHLRTPINLKAQTPIILKSSTDSTMVAQLWSPKDAPKKLKKKNTAAVPTETQNRVKYRELFSQMSGVFCL